MLDAQDLPDLIAGRADVLPPASVCSCTEGGLDAARVHVAGALDIATAAQLEREPASDDRVLRLSGAMVVAVLIAAAIVDESDAGGYGARQAWLYATVLAVGCIVSRGPAKSCSRDPSTENG
jgi:hypothetical protein